MDSRKPKGPIEVEGVPSEEDVSTADVAERVDRDPEEQPNASGEHYDRLRAAATGIADRTDPEDS
jgi:hypothetical protein